MDNFLHDLFNSNITASIVGVVSGYVINRTLFNSIDEAWVNPTGMLVIPIPLAKSFEYKPKETVICMGIGFALPVVKTLYYNARIFGDRTLSMIVNGRTTDIIDFVSNQLPEEVPVGELVHIPTPTPTYSSIPSCNWFNKCMVTTVVGMVVVGTTVYCYHVIRMDNHIIKFDKMRIMISLDDNIIRHHQNTNYPNIFEKYTPYFQTIVIKGAEFANNTKMLELIKKIN